MLHTLFSNTVCLLVHTCLSSSEGIATNLLTHSCRLSSENATTCCFFLCPFLQRTKGVLFQTQKHVKKCCGCLQVNATGVMPVIFSSSLLALPTALARYANSRPVEAFAAALNPSGPFYLPVSSLSNTCTGDLLS